ncbi:MAG: hypothetical protein PHF84_03075 [bacterium]|nr:hypothetical protein [bacterium]
MVKRIIFTIFKYFVYLVLLLSLTAVLAKTGNMPAAMPREYVKKIIEYTDLTLIKLKIIRDEKIISKYYSRKALTGANQLPLEAQYKINLLDKIKNFLFLNNYEIDILTELNEMAKGLNQFTVNQKEKLNSLINSTYVMNYIQETEVGIKNSGNTLALLYNIIVPVKEIRQMYILDNNGRQIYQYITEETSSLDFNKLKSQYSEGMGMVTYNQDNKTYLLVRLKNSKASFYFILSPDYLYLYLSELNLKNKFFILDQTYSILYSNMRDPLMVSLVREHLKSRELRYHETDYKIRMLKLSQVELSIGLTYKSYPAWKVLMNILKSILVLAAVWILFISLKLITEKVKTWALKKKPSQLDLITGAMLEVAKSVKSSASLYQHQAGISASVNINPEDMEKAVENVISKYLSAEQEQGTAEKNVKKKDLTEWKFIEPY